MDIKQDIKYIGVNDYKIDLFESQFKVEHGMTYNSYVILDDKVAVMDTVDADFGDEWLHHLDLALNGRIPDYLVVHHMESDHSANIDIFMQKYQDAIIVSSLKAFQMMKNFFGSDYAERRIIVKEGDSLKLGQHELVFIGAPMVHWPEVMLSYDNYAKVLFTADAFGKFGAMDAKDNWDDEARRYYIGIVGKYGLPVQNLLKKVAKYDVEMICPLHGPVLKDNLAHYLGLYDCWSAYRPEKRGVVLAYTSVYGHTKEAVLLLADKLKAKGVEVKVFDLCRCDMSEAVSMAFAYDRLVLATTTYNCDIFPAMHDFIHHLTSREFQNRKLALIENGSWACTANRVMQAMFANSKNITYADHKVTIMSALNNTSLQQIEDLADELSK